VKGGKKEQREMRGRGATGGKGGGKRCVGVRVKVDCSSALHLGGDGERPVQKGKNVFGKLQRNKKETIPVRIPPRSLAELERKRKAESWEQKK